MKKDAYYFPHFCNARHDRKLKRIQKDLGLEGYGIFFMLLEVLREQTDFKYPFTDVDLLADEFGTSTAKVEAVIKLYDLFYVDDIGNFFSPKLIFYLQPYLEKSERARIAANKRWNNSVSEHANALLEQSKCNANEMLEQCVGNASKVKESKINILPNTVEHNTFFENIWLLYPNKKGKARVTEKQKKILLGLGLEVITTCIERYKQNKPTWQEYQHGSTFFTSGYVDYLDKNYINKNTKIKENVNIVNTDDIINKLWEGD